MTRRFGTYYGGTHDLLEKDLHCQHRACRAPLLIWSSFVDLPAVTRVL
jgi:hypothetical protein